MVQSLISLASTLLLLAAGCSDMGVEQSRRELRSLTQTERKLVRANGNFWLKLLKETNSQETDRNKNIFISPLSVSTALCMTLNGARGETFDSMQTALTLEGLSLTEINEASRSLTELLTNADSKVLFRSANSIWYRADFTVEQDFIDRNRTYYDAAVTALDFRSPDAVVTINDWVRAKTNGRIQEIVASPIPEHMVMYLINAIYFKGVWKYKFDPTQTRDDIFRVTTQTNVPCKMMTQKSVFGYYFSDEFQAVDLQYGDGHFSMTVLLPSVNRDINAFLQSLTPELWNRAVSNLQELEIILSIPKFKFEYDLNLKPILEALGMAVAFDPYRANFTGINADGRLFISEAKHKTFVEVNEEGTEAAAATSIGIGIVSAPPVVRVDRPFVFVIREKSSGAILFVGKVMRPTS